MSTHGDDPPPTDPHGSSVPPPPLDLLDSLIRKALSEVLAEHAKGEEEHHRTVRDALQKVVDDRFKLHERVAHLERVTARLERRCPLLRDECPLDTEVDTLPPPAEE